MLFCMNDITRAFHKLHESGCFVMPNPWDPGSARLLEGMGFPALATTSAGFAWSLGKADNGVRLDEALAHCRAISSAVAVPVNADFEGGFAVEPDAVGENVTAATATGVAGLSIEDSTVDGGAPLFAFELAVERIRAARQAIDSSGTGVLLTARCETYLVGQPDIGEAVRRLQAYAAAGADCLYAPRVTKIEEIRTLVEAVTPKPLNVLVGDGFTTVDELRALGVRRISVGGALARAALAGFLEAAREIAGKGTFSSLNRAAPFAEINSAFPQK